MGFLRKVRKAIEKGNGYLAKMTELIEHSTERLDFYQAKLNARIDQMQATDVSSILTELKAVREQLAAVQATLAEFEDEIEES